MLNLDTHILLFALDGSLKPAEQALLTSEPWSISAIVEWELAKLHSHSRLAPRYGGLPKIDGTGLCQ